jgi:S-adenosylmethionine-diacylglycerol 3-amino-3-carboxypropyl transferase
VAYRREALDRVEIVTGSIHQSLEAYRGPYSAYSLSDVGSYLSDDEYGRLWHAIIETAQPGARVCERQFLVKRPVPTEVVHRIRLDLEMERALEESDDSLFYTFVVAHVARGGCD